MFFLKRITVIPLLLIVVLSQFGYYCFYAYQIYCAKQLAKEQLFNQIPDEALTGIRLNDNKQIYWEEEGKELSFKGQMYDVVREKVRNGNTYLLCVSDEREDKLLTELSDLIKVNTDANSNNTGKHHLDLKFQLNDIIFSKHSNFSQEKSIVYITTPQFYDYTSPLNLTYKKVHCPPPKA